MRSDMVPDVPKAWTTALWYRMKLDSLTRAPMNTDGSSWVVIRGRRLITRTLDVATFMSSVVRYTWNTVKA